MSKILKVKKPNDSRHLPPRVGQVVNFSIWTLIFCKKVVNVPLSFMSVPAVLNLISEQEKLCILYDKCQTGGEFIFFKKFNYANHDEFTTRCFVVMLWKG